MNAVRLLTIGLMLASAAPGVTASPERSGDIGPAKEKEATRGESLVEIIGARQDLTIFAKLIKTSGLEENLRKGGPFTILAPTDEAFRMLPDGALEELMLADKRSELAEMLRYHVLPSHMQASRIRTGEVTTLQGSKVAFNADGSTIWVGRAELVTPDINAANGVIHTITMVMEPDEQ
jgi:uncharacterized surface protein with fasciclin (FAS1) repeats